MGPNRLLAVLGALSFVAACQAKSPPGAESAAEDGLVARTKAQLGIDGGASLSGPPTIPTTETITSTQTQSATSTYTVSATGNATDTANVYYFSWTKTGTATATANRTATVTTTNISVGTKSTVATMTVTNPYGGTQTKTVTANVTVSGTLTGTSLSRVLTVTATSTNPTTGTKTHTYAGTASQTFTATGSNTGTGTQSWTYTLTQTGTQTGTASNVCNGTWAFCDNFESGNATNWNVRQGPVQNFSLQADGTKVYAQSDFTGGQLYISQAGSAWMDSAVEAIIKPTNFSTNSSAAMVTLWGHYDSTWGADCGYYVALRADGKVALGKRVAGVDSALGTPVAVSGGIAAGNWYGVKLEFVGSTIKAYVGGTLLLTQTDTSCDAGSIGVGSVGSSFEADDVRVTAPTTNTCVQDWRNTTCGAFCTYQAGVQSDRAGCGAYLDCYASNGCSPETCGGPDDVCGVNRLNPWGNASKEVADQVYKCMGCAGSVDCSKDKYYNGTVCADGNPCTWGDTCQNKVCVPDPNRNTQCSASDQCHEVGTCDTTSGMCSDPAKPDNTDCDDGDRCTPHDQCQGGECKPGLAIICQGDQCHTAGNCDPTTGFCSTPTKPDGTGCDDGNLCTNDDRCQGGTCAGVADPILPPARNVAINVVASFDASSVDAATGQWTDGTQIFPTPTEFTLPPVISVVEGLAGMGTAILTFHSATACLDISCTYHGASTVPKAVTPLDKTLGHMYQLQSCSDGSPADAVLSITRIGIHVDSGDIGTPRVTIQILSVPPSEAGGSTPDGGPGTPVGVPVPTPKPPDYLGDLQGQLSPPDYSSSRCTPVINGHFTPQPNPGLPARDPLGN